MKKQHEISEGFLCDKKAERFASELKCKSLIETGFFNSELNSPII